MSKMRIVKFAESLNLGFQLTGVQKFVLRMMAQEPLDSVHNSIEFEDWETGNTYSLTEVGYFRYLMRNDRIKEASTDRKHFILEAGRQSSNSTLLQIASLYQIYLGLEDLQETLPLIHLLDSRLGEIFLNSLQILGNSMPSYSHTRTSQQSLAFRSPSPPDAPFTIDLILTHAQKYLGRVVTHFYADEFQFQKDEDALTTQILRHVSQSSILVSSQGPSPFERLVAAPSTMRLKIPTWELRGDTLPHKGPHNSKHPLYHDFQVK